MKLWGGLGKSPYNGCDYHWAGNTNINSDKAQKRYFLSSTLFSDPEIFRHDALRSILPKSVKLKLISVSYFCAFMKDAKNHIKIPD